MYNISTMQNTFAAYAILLCLLLYACKPDSQATSSSSNCGQSTQGLRGHMTEQEKTLIANLKKIMEADLLAEVIEDANNIIAKYPNNVEALNYRGLARARSNDLEGGIKDFDEAIRIDPQFVRPYCNKGLSLYKLGDKLKARTCFDKAIEVDNCDAKSYFNRGLLNFDELKKGEACVDWKKAIELGYDDKLNYYHQYCEGQGVPVTRKKDKNKDK